MGTVVTFCTGTECISATAVTKKGNMRIVQEVDEKKVEVVDSSDSDQGEGERQGGEVRERNTSESVSVSTVD